jgi:glycosyltransferase involved in cell wall biosynthesis
MASLALDLRRLAAGGVRFSPRGIDRVELAYARHFLTRWPDDCFAVLPTVWGVRGFERERALRGLALLDELWRETVEPGQDEVYREAKRFLDGEAPAARLPERRSPSVLQTTRAAFRALAATGFTFGRSIGRTLPRGSIYLNVGQLLLFRPSFSWLKRRPDIHSVFMIHDLIPLQLPEHHLPIGIRLHRAIVRNTAEFARALIVPSEAAANSVRRELAASDRPDIPIHVEHLAVPSEFLHAVTPDSELNRRDYFIVCGTIDSYKNHLLLLRVWTELAAAHGPRTPKLIIAGSPGVTSGEVLRYLSESAAICDHVLVASGLSTPALRQLIIGAKALLMPSLAEGFGLPIVEALAQATPVVASDIPAHREAGRGGAVIFLPPTDVAAWQHQSEQLATQRGRRDESSVPGYEPKTWEAYFSGVERFLGATISRAK